VKRWVKQYFEFGLVGGSGALINWGILYALVHFFGVWYLEGEVIATFIAFTWNFALNYRWTFNRGRDFEEDHEVVGKEVKAE
jgi:putative flippase GtrA